MKLIIGLGNPGEQYNNTRHNIGFKAIDALKHHFKVELNKKKFNGIYHQNKAFILAKPLTFMNLSGEFVVKIMRYFKIPVENILVIYDDTAHEVGTLSLKPQGSSNGHNGLQSIIDVLNTNKFPRLKIGISNTKIKKSAYVLGKFTNDEIIKISPLKHEIIAIVKNFIEKDINFTMNELHRKKQII